MPAPAPTLSHPRILFLTAQPLNKSHVASCFMFRQQSVVRRLFNLDPSRLTLTEWMWLCRWNNDIRQPSCFVFTVHYKVPTPPPSAERAAKSSGALAAFFFVFLFVCLIGRLEPKSSVSPPRISVMLLFFFFFFFAPDEEEERVTVTRCDFTIGYCSFCFSAPKSLGSLHFYFYFFLPDNKLTVNPVQLHKWESPGCYARWSFSLNLF